MTRASRAFSFLATLQPGDAVPDACYVLARSDGSPARWVVASALPLRAGVVRLVLVDDANRLDDGDLFTPGTPAAVVVLTWKRKTLRSQPFVYGGTPGPTLCDLDQQARHVAKVAHA